MKTSRFKIGDLCELKYGKALKSENRSEGNYPVYGSSGIVGYHNKYLVENPTLIIGRKGSVGEIYFSEGPCWPIDTAYYLEYNSEKVDLKFFKCLLTSLNLKSLDKSAAVPGLNRNDVYNLEINIPSLDDQINIANILGKAEAMIHQRKDSLSLLDEYLNSTFSEMFGDPVRNEKGWDTRTIEELVKGERYSIKRGPFGGALKKEMFVQDGYLVYEQFHALNDDFTFARYYINEEKFQELKAFEVKPGDIIISCSGVYLGKLAVVPEGSKKGIINQALLKLSLDTNVVNRIYFVHLFRHNSFRVNFFGDMRGSGIPNFPPMEEFKKFNFIFPPLELQAKFANVVEKVGVLKADYLTSLKELENLYASLSQRAFKGELTLK